MNFNVSAVKGSKDANCKEFSWSEACSSGEGGEFHDQPINFHLTSYDVLTAALLKI